MPIVLSEVSRILLLIMYALLSKAVNGYHFVKDKYLEYKYTTDDVQPTECYLLTPQGREEFLNPSKLCLTVPKDRVYIEEWMDTKGRKKMIALYEGEVVPTSWTHTPFELPPARCPWVWVGDKETEIDMTRTFDKFLVPGNQIRMELAEKLIKITDHTHLIYIESGTLNEIEFPGDGITIESDE